MTDLVSRLLEAITAKEAKARAASPSPWTLHRDSLGDDHWADISAADGSSPVDTESGAIGPDLATAEFIADNDPAAVLRRCAADRLILSIHQVGTAFYEDELGSGDRVDVPEWYCKACVDQSPNGLGVLVGDDSHEKWPCATARHLAMGYGLEVTE